MTTPTTTPISAIEVRGLRKQFTVGMSVKKRTALDGMSLTVKPGEIYGFLGPNGAGKTTTIKVLTSLLQQDSGEATLFGLAPTTAEARRRLGYLAESPVFYDHLTGREFLLFCGKLYGMERAVAARRAGELLEKVGLSQAGDLQIRRYSKGMTQRVGIAQAILHNPDLVILDEPMSGLDPMGRADIRDIIVELQKEGKTIFFSTHIIPDVEVICSRIGVVNKGKMVREGSVTELLNEGSSEATEVVVANLPAAFAPPQDLVATALEHPDGKRVFLAPTAEALKRLLQEILNVGGAIVSVAQRRDTLENLVIRMLAQP